jgi:hypothetical protein
VVDARLGQAFDDWDEERSCPARRLDEGLATEILVGRVANEVEDEVNDPAAGEDFSVVGAGVRGELSEGHGVLEEGELTGLRHGIRLSRTCVR